MSALSGKETVSSFGKEWLGLLGAFFWFFSLLLSYDGELMSGTAVLAVFMIMLGISLFGFAMLADRRETVFRRIIFPTCIAGAGLTVSLGFLPGGFVQATFCLIPVLMAPLLCRRMFGVFVMARPGWEAQGYISAVSATIFLHLIWVMLPVGDSVRFGLCAVMALVGLWRAESVPAPTAVLTSQSKAGNPYSVPALGAVIPTPVERRSSGIFRRTATTILFLTLLSAFNLFCSFVHTAVVRGTYLEGDLFAASAYILMPFSFLFFAWMSDRGKGRRGFLIGIGLVFAGCCVAVLPTDSLWKAPFLLLGEFGGTITEFTFLTAALKFFPTANRRYLVAATGLILHTFLASLPSWLADLFMPASFLDPALSRGFVVFGASSAFLLVFLYFWLSDNSREASPAGTPEPKNVSRAEMPEGSLTTPTVDDVTLFASQYDLTDRQTDILAALLEGGTSKDIARRLFVTEATVKFHVHNILAKTGMRNRSELAALLAKRTSEED